MPASISLDDAAAARAWFAEVVEPLSDGFDPAHVERYVELFTALLERVYPEWPRIELMRRYERIRGVRVFSSSDPEDVFVLSRVTLGADVAITSVLLDAAKRRFPNARIWFAGSNKGYDLFAADPEIRHAAAAYARSGSLRDRIAASRGLTVVLEGPNTIVIDPDSRLTQLGLVPVCPEERYFFFESRGSSEAGTLSHLAARWAERTFGVVGAKAYLAPTPSEDGEPAEITVSLGVGENPAKRVPDPFERRLMEAIARLGRTVLVDKGAGGDESERVVRATGGLPNLRLFEGSFAAFASRIARSQVYIGYDSAGQHAAAACSVPLVAVFAGYPNPRFLERWKPSGAAAIEVVLANGVDPASLVDRVMSGLARFSYTR